ncbi:MAG: Asp-tRNA(Asn)/Glu-tRNA(Gln) amidotransferase subunit GatA [Acidobacteriota bacterium]
MVDPDWTATAIHARFVRGDISASEACDTALARIAAGNADLNAFLLVDQDGARRRAADLDTAPDRAACGALAGVPVAIKDNLSTAGLDTTAGSRMLQGYRPPYTATAVARLEAAGAVVVGKTNCDEFAMGSSNEHSAFGPVRNPWARDRTPGGSSGGSAAAVAAGMAPIALGSDTGGSVRQPAGFCGIVGIRPTYGRVSRYGLVSFASSLDQIGVFATTVADAARVLGVMAGEDPRDATTASAPVPDWTAALTGDIRGCRIGVPTALIASGVDPDVAHAVATAASVLRDRGATVEHVDLPHSALAIPVYYVIATAEASSNLARYDGVRYGHRTDEPGSLLQMYERSRDEGFGAEVKRRIILGTFVLSAGYSDAFYARAQQVRRVITAELESVLTGVDAVLLPTSPTPAFRLGERLDDPLQMYLADVFTVGSSLAGLPALSMPGGYSASGLPIGIQLIGRRFDEAGLMRLAEAYERDTRWFERRPPAACGGRETPGR